MEPFLNSIKAWKCSRPCGGKGLLPAKIYPIERLEAALASADFVILTIPLTPRTRQLLNGPTLAAMKPGAVIALWSYGLTRVDRAVDAAVQAKLLGALNVSLVYRRGRDRMNASRYEQDLAASKGVRIITNAAPVAVHGDGAVSEVEFAYTEAGPEGLKTTGQTFRLKADQLFKPFTRLHQVEPSDGLGMGLAIASRCVERLGGRLWASSSPGKGSTFFFSLGKDSDF